VLEKERVLKTRRSISLDGLPGLKPKKEYIEQGFRIPSLRITDIYSMVFQKCRCR
jgi:hypothetical protein